MTADACRAVLIASLLLLPAFGHQITTAAELAAIYGIVAAEGAFAQFFNPSRLAVLGVVVAPGDLPSASGLLQATSSLAGTDRPASGRAAAVTLGVQWALLIDASSFALSFLAIRAIELPGPGRRRETGHAQFPRRIPGRHQVLRPQPGADRTVRGGGHRDTGHRRAEHPHGVLLIWVTRYGLSRSFCAISSGRRPCSL